MSNPFQPRACRRHQCLAALTALFMSAGTVLAIVFLTIDVFGSGS